MRSALAALTLASALCVEAADACVPLRLEPVPYPRGALLTQYVIHADVIQIVQARLLRVRIREAAFPGFDVGDFALVPVRTIAAPPFSHTGDEEEIASLVGGDPDELPWQSQKKYYLEDALNAHPFAAVAEARDDGFACRAGPYRIRDGDLFLALRDLDGRLYRGTPYSDDDQTTLEIEIDNQLVAPSLIRIRGVDDPMIARLELEIVSAQQARNGIARRVLIDRMSRLVYGRRAEIETLPSTMRTVPY